MTMGKAIGGGLPVGVMYAKPSVAALLVAGTHGCTLGGNSNCTAVAKTILDIIDRDRLTEHAALLGQQAIARLKEDTRFAKSRRGSRQGPVHRHRIEGPARAFHGKRPGPRIDRQPDGQEGDSPGPADQRRGISMEQRAG